MDVTALQKRIMEFSSSCMKLGPLLRRHADGKILASQLVRSASSISLNYAESISAESTKDYVHKLSISLKELMETDTCLKLIASAEIMNNSNIQELIVESNELQAILFSSIRTLKTKHEELDWRSK